MKTVHNGRFTQNILWFAKSLRRAGVSVGTAQILDAADATQKTGFTSRRDFCDAMRATLIRRREDLVIFDELFALFWRTPDFVEATLAHMLPVVNAPLPDQPPDAATTRAIDALGGPPPSLDVEPDEEVVFDAAFTATAQELIRNKDFAQMSADELKEAEKTILNLDLNLPQKSSRRYIIANRAHRVDARQTLRDARRTGGEILKIATKSHTVRPQNIVFICDISGSMSEYSRILLLFVRQMMLDRRGNWNQITAFTFGTRLSNVTRMLAQRDPDLALTELGQHVQDWDGGTRIADSLRAFNTHWAKRVMSGGSTVILVTDGLERDDTKRLAAEMKRLRLTADDVIWLNPLLRWNGFEPLAEGIQAMLPHVSRFLTCHSLNSLTSVGNILGDVNKGDLYK